MIKMLNSAVIVAYGRSAIARSVKGSLKNTHPIDYASEILVGVLGQVPALDAKLIDDVVVGCAKPELSQRQNIGKLIALRAGLPYSVAAQTVNRFCASGLQSISIAANMIMTGQAEVVVAGGVESMTAVPYMGIGDPSFKDKWLDENEPGSYISMGLTAENVAEMHHISREEMEEFALKSQEKAIRARDCGFLGKDIIPVTALDDGGGEFSFGQDECIRMTSLEKMAALAPCFKENGVVTAATSSPTSDGAGMAVLMSEQKAEELGMKPLVRFVGFAVAGVDPSYMGLGPIAAVPKVMEKTGLTVGQMDVIELNEAFAAQALPCIRTLGFDMEKVNPNGGAIALGHPLGATGTILTCKAISQLERIGGRYGLITMCIGGGMGAAGIIERI